MTNRRIAVPAALAIGAMLSWSAGLCAADTVELTNGDTLSGKVVSLDASELTLQSEVIGKVTLQRAKVAVVYFGDRKPPPVATAAQAAPARVGLSGQAAGSPEDLVRQMRQQGGVDADTMSNLQKQFPILALPEVQSYFNDTMTGLMTGTRSLGDVRKDAVKARDELLELQKDLGPNGQMLNGYLSILNKFIRETEPDGGETGTGEGKP